ncbi:unnamed protein product, partial [Candidula unifasciata]
IYFLLHIWKMPHKLHVFAPQLSLPKLPVPELQETMDKYLTLIKTVVSPQEYARTKSLVAEQQSMDNWANDWWLHDMYLNVRLPLVINSNPAAVFPCQNFPSRRHQIRFAAKFLCGMLDFKFLLDSRTLPVERCKHKEKGQPLCMEQHYRLFSSYREPARGSDIQRTDLGTLGTDYIVVACNNQFYKVDVQKAGEYISEADLSVQISRVLVMAEEREKAPEVGILTSQSRDVWADTRERLMQGHALISVQADIHRNRHVNTNLHILENCLFLLCLDKPTVPSRQGFHGGLTNDMTARTHHLIHGQGAMNNSCNRWMDKTIQVIISEDGTFGLNMEHSVAEGIALGHMIEYALGNMGKDKDTGMTHEPGSLPYPAYLRWNLSSQSLADIRTAKDDVDRMVEDFDLTVFRFAIYGRDFIKQLGMSPDAYIQLALQLTYYKIHGTLTSTYESASVRRFRQGRVDVIRANSPAALTWVRAMLGQTESTEDDKYRLLMEAVQWQQDYTLDTVLGHGIDLHLLGLREAATELGIPTPELFTDPSYKELNTFRLSTSQ